jgi:cephalosporin hydroxylase
MTFDLNEKIDLIKNESLENLKDSYFVENLIMKLGLYGEKASQYPEFLKPFFGGLNSWQNPNQFAKFLTFLSKYKINNYVEIGAFFGGTFITVCEYLKKINPEFKGGIAIDHNIYFSVANLEKVGIATKIINGIEDTKNVVYCQPTISTEESRKIEKISILNSYCEMNNYKYYKKPSTSFFAGQGDDLIKDGIDLILIDGDHSCEAVLKDFKSAHDLKTKIICCHDINSVCADSWKKICEKYGDDYIKKEIKDIYSDNYQFFGFGIMIRKDFW